MILHVSAHVVVYGSLLSPGSQQSKTGKKGYGLFLEGTSKHRSTLRGHNRRFIKHSSKIQAA